MGAPPRPKVRKDAHLHMAAYVMTNQESAKHCERGMIMEKPEGRLDSIDALRGFDMLFIMGLSAVIAKSCVALGFGNECWLARQMHHPPWIGLTHHDTIFPLFMFNRVEHVEICRSSTRSTCSTQLNMMFSNCLWRQN